MIEIIAVVISLYSLLLISKMNMDTEIGDKYKSLFHQLADEIEYYFIKRQK